MDHDQLQNDLDDLLRQNLEEAQQRWNFDFETETPLEGHFKWERVFLDDQPPQEVRSPVKITGGESRSSLVHKVSPKSRLGRIRPEESQQSLEIHRAGSPKILKRGQSTIKGEAWGVGGTPCMLGGTAGVMVSLVGTDGRDMGARALPGSWAWGGTTLHALLSWESRVHLPRGRGCLLVAGGEAGGSHQAFGSYS